MIALGTGFGLMQELIYAFFLLGSFSVGYSVVRTAMPNVQLEALTNKIAYGYGAGALIFGIPIAAIVLGGMNSDYFFLLGITMYVILMGIAFAKRMYHEEADPEIFVEEKKRKVAIPKMGLTKEEKMPVADRIRFEEGLMTKGSSPTPKVTPAMIKNQVFKDKNTNVLKVIDKNTKELESKSNKEQKNAALAKLRQMALDINDKKKSTGKKKKEEAYKEEDEEIEEIEEGLLNELGDEKE